MRVRIPRPTDGHSKISQRFIEIYGGVAAHQVSQMSEEYLEFSILSDRKYTRNHIWMQVVDKDEGTWKIGASDLIVQEMGDILRVSLAVLPSDALADNAAADNEFDFADVAEEFSEGDILFTGTPSGVGPLSKNDEVIASLYIEGEHILSHHAKCV